MRGVTAVGHEAGLTIATDFAGDDAELQFTAILVVLALDRLHRDKDAGQSATTRLAQDMRGSKPGASHASDHRRKQASTLPP